jgi:hypothetical protein
MTEKRELSERELERLIRMVLLVRADKALFEQAEEAMRPLSLPERKQLGRYLRLMHGDLPEDSCDADAALAARDKLTPEQLEVFERYVKAVYDL